jgi:phage shock protein E
MKNILLTLMVFGSFAAFAEDALKTSNDSNSILVDVRTDAEWNEGYIETAIHIPLNELMQKIELIAKNKKQRIYLYCRSGNRSGKAEQVLQTNGYIYARNIGGIKEASSKLQLKIIKK